jgi:signal transduction histidine kinase
MSTSIYTLAYKIINLSISEILLVFIIFALIVILILYWYIKLARQKNQMIELLKTQNTSTLKVHNDLKFAKEKAEESDRLKTYFLANVSHEIRTPLNAIMGFSSLLHDGTLSAEERNQFATLIHDNSNKLLDVMGEIFDIAQIESGIVTLQYEPCQVNGLLMSLASQFNIEKMLADKEHIGIRVKKSNKDAAFAILTDEHKLKQTLVNLIENALKYTEEGNIEFGYNLLEDRKVQFYVKDSGMGFQQEKLDILFERFRQFDEGHSRNFGGIGLGLTLSKKFVELLGGEMWAESTLGKGSTFSFTIPYEPAEKRKPYQN